MLNLSENFKSSRKNFNQYAQFGTVPTVKQGDDS